MDFEISSLKTEIRQVLFLYRFSIVLPTVNQVLKKKVDNHVSLAGAEGVGKNELSSLGSIRKEEKKNYASYEGSNSKIRTGSGFKSKVSFTEIEAIFYL